MPVGVMILFLTKFLLYPLAIDCVHECKCVHSPVTNKLTILFFCVSPVLQQNTVTKLLFCFTGSSDYTTQSVRSVGPYHLDNVDCEGDEANLLNCSHNGIGVHNCAPGKDAGVRCDGKLYLSLITTTQV